MIPKWLSGLGLAVALAAGVAWAEPGHGPDPVNLSWEYPLDAQLLLVNGGFRLYRDTGFDCSLPYSLTDPARLTADVPPILRGAVDTFIPPDFAGEVCYEVTAYWVQPPLDPTLPQTPVMTESWPSPRVGFSRRAAPVWWGESVEVK